MTTILFADPRVTEERLEPFRREYPDARFVIAPDRAAVGSLIAEADGFFGGLSNEHFLAARRLRWIQSTGAGVEWMWRIPTIADSEVVVTNLRGAHAVTIAEHAFAFLLTLTRRLRDFERLQEREEWARGQLNRRMVGLKGLTMGIIGFGNIGRAIAHRAAGFEMNVLAVDAQPVPPSDGAAEVWPLSRLNDLCRAADVLAIAAPITPETRGMVGAEQIGLLKPGSFLLAMSRGGIVDEPALIAALEAGHLAGAGLDVTAVEPLPPGDPLWKAPNCIITPHNSPASDLTNAMVWSIVSENLHHFLRGEPLINVVDKRRGY
jgi:phosphoglycerate dehydrogenase-like enzyme